MGHSITYRITVGPQAGRKVFALGIYCWYSPEEVFQRIQALAGHPDMGRMVPEFDQPFRRELIHPPFRIVYRRDPKRVRIVRVWRSERLLHLPSADSAGSLKT